ncbi:hypothetical protein BJX76DRAFT_327414 [Aspergillus varians]
MHGGPPSERPPGLGAVPVREAGFGIHSWDERDVHLGSVIVSFPIISGLFCYHWAEYGKSRQSARRRPILGQLKQSQNTAKITGHLPAPMEAWAHPLLRRSSNNALQDV